MDFTWNELADPKFVFHDPSLVELVREGDLAAQHFFRLLALCHTVMPEEKTEGEDPLWCPPPPGLLQSGLPLALALYIQSAAVWSAVLIISVFQE